MNYKGHEFCFITHKNKTIDILINNHKYDELINSNIFEALDYTKMLIDDFKKKNDDK